MTCQQCLTCTRRNIPPEQVSCPACGSVDLRGYDPGASVTKHTPGPWAILPTEADKLYIRVRGTALGARYKIANVLFPVAVAWEVGEAAANARLIAAAPEMLEALKRVAELLEVRSDDIELNSFAGMIDDAIRKAEEGQ